MEIGFLTAPFMKENLEHVLKFAAENGFSKIEVVSIPGAGHIVPEEVLADSGKKLKNLFQSTGVKPSSYACYVNVLDPSPTQREQIKKHLKNLILVAELTEVDVVCTMAGMPLPGKTKMQTIEQDTAEYFSEVCSFAAAHGVRIALENWFATNIQHLEHWKKLFELVPDSNFGLNFDPSHLVHQGIDYLSAVDDFATRIFHTHAKDCEIKQHLLRRIGNQEKGWWRYVIPGYGKICWGEYIGRLRKIGYNGVLSIEHEDGAVGREEGFIISKKYLSQFIL
ncbi:MAG: fructoselysine 3-epimerase [candidate division TA06 bacterium ADurb.Bin131]|uniref:Fructoselysine 3-epimerase n=1 Tax=candidate division TA06 bacterium ADurb.Bin131 TaxID=1852827 RepID=A0A1V6CBG7_UNCT6|nr:MAG: fructoselysine 3-epimerase [candidate division TA06 bacterium ADurb.Bin131]HQL65500.1 sugar phosphate isomerase/epimerase [bacterium]